MSQLTLEVLAGVLVAAISGAMGLLLQRLLVERTWILPNPRRQHDTKSYKHLAGDWYLYYLTYMPLQSDPVWLGGTQNLEIRNNRVRGTTSLGEHPLGALHYTVRGEIRAGKMVMTDSCVEDETDFALLLYPNLRASTTLIGLWSGVDNRGLPIAAPAVLSRKSLTSDEVFRLAASAAMHLISMGS